MTDYGGRWIHYSVQPRLSDASYDMDYDTGI